MYSIEYTGYFLKQAKQCKKRGITWLCSKKTIRLLAESGKLPPEYQAHKLKGKYKGSG
jgi:mRNA-degrading endonuclease YafQ of YafQ-DinJ toxin-antitoxin module